MVCGVFLAVRQLIVAMFFVARLAVAAPPHLDIQCSLNGWASGEGCACKSGWTGLDCGTLDFAPAPANHSAFRRSDIASWGGTVLFAEGEWHLIFALIEGHCGLQSWMPNSAVWHASSDSPIGPFINETRVLPHFAHNPVVTRAPDGTWLIWHIGDAAGKSDGFRPNCSAAKTPGFCPPPPPPLAAAKKLRSSGTWPLPKTQINAAASTSVNGPWVDSGIFASDAPPIDNLNNPAPVHLANGTTLVMGRSWNKNQTSQLWNSTIGIARSDRASWNSTYTTLAQGYPQYLNITSPVPHGSAVQLEDPFMWQAADGSFHALFHSMGGCPNWPEAGRGGAVGCHAFSEDSFLWRMSKSGGYDYSLDFDDGTTKHVARRERPQLVFNKAGDPAFLVNGVQDSWSCDNTYTHVQPIKAAWP